MIKQPRFIREYKKYLYESTKDILNDKQLTQYVDRLTKIEHLQIRGLITIDETIKLLQCALSDVLNESI